MAVSWPQTSFMGHLICFQKIFQLQDLNLYLINSAKF